MAAHLLVSAAPIGKTRGQAKEGARGVICKDDKREEMHALLVILRTCEKRQNKCEMKNYIDF